MTQQTLADYLSKNPTPEFINYIKDEQIYFKFIGVVKYDKDSIWIFTRLKSLIKKSLQIVFGKSDSKESWLAARRETREETGFELFQMQYLVINEDYDCNIYIYNIERFKLRCLESLKAGS